MWRFDGAVTISIPGTIHSEAELVAAVVSQYGTDQEFTTVIGHAMDAEVSHIL
jgi:pimeloyl-ACP methyl ester carboxylesterase